MNPEYGVVKVFSATKVRDRESLGERITEYVQAHPELEPTRYQVLQSSDSAFHCLSIILFLTRS